MSWRVNNLLHTNPFENNHDSGYRDKMSGLAHTLLHLSFGKAGLPAGRQGEVSTPRIAGYIPM